MGFLIQTFCFCFMYNIVQLAFKLTNSMSIKLPIEDAL